MVTNRQTHTHTHKLSTVPSAHAGEGNDNERKQEKLITFIPSATPYLNLYLWPCHPYLYSHHSYNNVHVLLPIYTCTCTTPTFLLMIYLSIPVLIPPIPVHACTHTCTISCTLMLPVAPVHTCTHTTHTCSYRFSYHSYLSVHTCTHTAHSGTHTTHNCSYVQEVLHRYDCSYLCDTGPIPV